MSVIDTNLLEQNGITIIPADVAVIGGGPAGLAAAVSASSEGASVVLIERDNELGGILRQCIHNGFGLHYFGEELTGPEYATRFIQKLEESNGIKVLAGTMALEIKENREILAVSREGILLIKAKALVLAMGCRERTRGALNIPGDRPAGIFTAGCAQLLVNMEGYMPGKRAVILGSGDIGLIMARRLTFEGAKVEAVCEIMPYSSGLNRNIVQCLHDYDIPLYLNHTITNIQGRERLESVTIAKVDDNRRPIPDTERVIPCDTLLLSVGLIPENELTRAAGIEMDTVTGGARVDQSRQTSAEGIFACGNALHVHDLVDNVSDEANIAGKSAAMFAKKYEADCEIESVCAESKFCEVVPGDGIRYVVPQRISVPASGKCTLYFRVSDVRHNANIEAVSGSNVIARAKKRIVTPGEMEYLEIDLSKAEDKIILQIPSSSSKEASE